jgi:beta-N-acetylhexosaminidase
MDKQIYQILMIGLQGPDLLEVERQHIKDFNPGGVILFKRNCVSATQVTALCEEIYSLSDITPLIAVDEEGGLVRRLRSIYNSIPSISTFARDADDSEIEEFAKSIGTILKSLGINLNLAPVVDLHHNDTDNALRQRYWGITSESVIAKAKTFLTGLQKTGVWGCLKHFPGLGRATLDSHFHLPSVDISMEDLVTSDLQPFIELGAMAPMVMMAHCAFPEITGNSAEPSTVQKEFYELCRKQADFKRIIIADDLGMKAIHDILDTGSMFERLVLAGATMLPVCNDFEMINESFAVVEELAAKNLEFKNLADEAANLIVQVKREWGLFEATFKPDLQTFTQAKQTHEELVAKWL